MAKRIIVRVIEAQDGSTQTVADLDTLLIRREYKRTLTTTMDLPASWLEQPIDLAGFSLVRLVYLESDTPLKLMVNGSVEQIETSVLFMVDAQLTSLSAIVGQPASIKLLLAGE